MKTKSYGKRLVQRPRYRGGRIILKQIFQKWALKMWMNTELDQDSVQCDIGDEHSSAKTGGTFTAN
jgi:hypothetical protein